MTVEIPSIEEIEERVAAMAPPNIPAHAFGPDNFALFGVKKWDRIKAAALIGGLLVDPRFHANGNRIDWLLRLVVTFARGHKAPTQYDLGQALNDGLGAAGVIHREDPPEELFVEQVVTARGNFTIFPGQWETPTAYTQTLLTAFESLPEGGQKQRALESGYALLHLSQLVAAAAALPPMMPGTGTPFEAMSLPAHRELQSLAQLVNFTKAQLLEAGIDFEDLRPFVLTDEHAKIAALAEPGDSTLDCFPLLEKGETVIVASPQNLSTAVRALLLDTAIRGGMGDALRGRLMIAQEKFAEEGAFWPLQKLNLFPPDRFGMRQSICQYEPGRYLQVIQTSPELSGFPQQGFASLRKMSSAAYDGLARHVESFWQFLRSREDQRSSVTVILIGGWGCPFAILPKLDELRAPANWEYLSLSFADCAVLGVAENSRFDDVVRILRQQRLLEADGYTFLNPSGFLNLLGFWRMTGGNFVPEHMADIVPPCTMMMGTNDLLEPRQEAAERRGYRAIRHPDGRHKAVQRLQWSNKGKLREIFASPADLEYGRLSGVVVRQGRSWWIEVHPKEGESRDWAYQVWNAALQWLDAIASGVIAKRPESFSANPVRIELSTKGGFKFARRYEVNFGEGDLAHAVKSESDGLGGSIELSTDWLNHLGVTENAAELELISAVLEVISLHGTAPLSRNDLRNLILEILRSKDWRWLHAREAVSIHDQMGVSGLIASFRKVPFSAYALARCRSIWNFRNRSAGSIISGESECQLFLLSYRDAILDSIIKDVRTFDRQKLVHACMDAYQAARIEQGRWRSTIKALRAISGAVADDDAFEHQNEINAVQRAAKIIAEIAACESALENGLVVGKDELADLFAKALLIFGNGQLFSAMKVGLIKAELRISPGGDLLSEREIFSDLLHPGAKWMNRKVLDDAASSYGEKRSKKPEDIPEKLSWEIGLREAVEAEYGVSAEGFVDLQHVLWRIAERSHEGVLFMRRSALIEALKASENYPVRSPEPMIERLTLPCRSGWRDVSGYEAHDFDVGRFDRAWSLISRPLLALDNTTDPLLAIAPIMISDSMMYSYAGLQDGVLNNDYWVSESARSYAGARGDAIGAQFEEDLAEKLATAGLDATPRCKISALLNEKVPAELGDIDIFAVSPDRKHVWVIEAKNLKLCRTESEVSARLSLYRGRMISKGGRDKPDKMLRHLRRVAYIRDRREALMKRLKFTELPEVYGLMIVDAPQPMSVVVASVGPDGQTILADEISAFHFNEAPS